MKKVLFLAVAATMLFAACNKTEVVYDNDPQEISFLAVNKVATKAPVDGTTFLTEDDMTVAAYLAQGDAGNNATTNGNYFPGTLFENNGTYWAGGRYWPLSESIINFLAISQPGAIFPVATVFDATTPASGAVVTLDDNAPYQYDLMYAAGQGHCKPGSYPVVPMVFRHALTWIYFNVNTNATGVDRIRVNSITLNDAVYNGKLTVTNNSYNVKSTYASADANVEAEWTVVGPEQDVAVSCPGGVACVAAAQPFGNGLLILPGAQKSFTVNYTITHSTGVTNTFDYTHVLAGTWDMAKKYIYNITLNLNEILIDPVVKDWVDVETNVPLG